MANPKGNPNIAEYGKKTQFNGCTAVVAGQESQKVQAVQRSYYELAKDNVPLEHKLAHIQKLDEMAQNGDIKALELLLKILKEYEDRLTVESECIEIHFNAV